MDIPALLSSVQATEVPLASLRYLSSSATSRSANEELRSAFASIYRCAGDCGCRNSKQSSSRASNASLSRRHGHANRMRKPVPYLSTQKANRKTKSAKKGECITRCETPGKPGRGCRNPFPQRQIDRLFAGEQRAAFPQDRDPHDDSFVRASEFRSGQSSGPHCFLMKCQSTIQCGAVCYDAKLKL